MAAGEPHAHDDAAMRGLAEMAEAMAKPHDARTVLDLMVERVRVLLHASACFVILVADDQRLRITASSGLVTRFREVTPQHDREGLTMLALSERRTLTSPDMLNDPAVRLGPAGRAFIEREGYRSCVAIPLSTGTRVLGVLMVGRTVVGDFAPAEIAQAEAFARLGTIALESARLSSLEAARTRADEALSEIERDLVGELSIDRLLPRLGVHARRLLAADASIYLAETERRRLRRVWSSGPPAPEDVDFGVSPIGRCAESRKGLIDADRSMAQPLLSRGQLLGVIAMERGEGAEPFTAPDLALLRRFAAEASLALRNATLYAELRTNEARTRLVINTALDAVVTIDVNGIITQWNAQAERTFGWRQDEVLGRVLSETIIPARYRAAHEAGLRRYRTSGEGAVVNRRLELSALHRDGHEFPVELSISPVSVGTVTTFSAFVRDITERRAAEGAIRRHTALVQLLRTVAVAANEAPTARAAMQIVVDQVCAFTGWPVGDAFVLAEDGSGELVSAHVWHLDEPERYRLFREVTDRGRFSPGIGLPGRVLASGRAAWIMDVTTDRNFPRAKAAADIGVKGAFGFPVLAGTEIVAVLEFFAPEPREPDPALLDVMANVGTQLGRVFERTRAEGELRRAKDAAESASRAKSSFLATMSHELRTPLNAILGYAQVLARDAEVGSSRRRAIEVIEGSGEHLLSLINEVLDLAKIEAGTIDIQRAPFEFPAMLAALADIMAARARDKGLTFTYEVSPVLPAFVEADEKRLRQVLINLLDNAIKYTPAGGVTFAVASHGGRSRFTVEDTGIGIGADDLPTIFETFHQVGRREEFVDGAGLGLAISKTLVALMGGTLDVESELGRGSRFWFELELPEVPGPDGVPLLPIVGVHGRRRRLLVVDDHADNRGLLRDLLVPAGFEVETAEDAAACLARVTVAPPDAVLLDIRMPDMSGLEATRRVRALGLGSERLVVIAVSASVFGHDRDECLAAGADDFLAKPFRLDQLLALLCRHLDLEPVRGVVAPPARSREDALVFPPADAVAALLEQARRGDIEQVLEHAARIEASDARCRRFVAELRALAERFQVKKLCQFLEGGRPIP